MLAALSDRADEDGYCWPSNEWIADKCSPMPKETVRRVIRELADQKLVEKVERRRRDDGTLSVWLLRVTVPTSVHGCTVDQPDQRAPMTKNLVTSARTESSREPLISEANASETPKPRKARKPDLLWDAFSVELGEPATDSERGRRNAALRQLRKINATPEQIRARIDTYLTRWPEMECTETAIVAYWTLLGNGNGHVPPGMLPAGDWRAEMEAHDRERTK